MAEIRATQARLAERNAAAKLLISQKQEMLCKQLNARKELLQQSASRVAAIRADLAAAEAQEAELVACLADEQCVQPECTQESRPSGSEELSGGFGEEWFAEDERSFSADGHDYARPLQCKNLNQPVVIRRPDFSTREKSLGSVRRTSPLFKFSPPKLGRAELAYLHKEAPKVADLDATGILEDDAIDRVIHADQPLLSDLLVRNRHNSTAITSDHISSKRAHWLQEIQVHVSKTTKIRNVQNHSQPGGTLASKLHQKTQSFEYQQHQGLASQINMPFAQ